MLRRVFFALLASTTVFAAPEIDLGLTPEMLHGILREVAAKIEARHGSERPEAEKLVERIEAILATEPPPAREGDRAQAIAEGMHLINIDASAKSSLGGFRGYLFDGSLTGCLQTYHDLEKLDAKDADLDRYVTEKALDGLFFMIAEQEKTIRANPLKAGSAVLNCCPASRVR